MRRRMSSDSRVQDFLTKTPVITLSLLSINILIHIFLFVTSWNIGNCTFNPARVLYNGQYYRVFTSAFIHGGIMHIAMNMMSLIAMGGILEPAFGSIRFFWMTWVAIIWEGIISTLLSWLWLVIIGDPSFMNSNSVGFSGVLFAYAVIEAFHSHETSRSLFGVLSFPTKIYPFVLLVVLQVILPNISLIGHLGGILAGLWLMSSIGYHSSMLSQGGFEWLENSSCLGPIRRLSSYRLITTKEMIHPFLELRTGGNGDVRQTCCLVWSTVSGIFLYLLSLCWQLLVTVAHIFGMPVERCQACGTRWYAALCQSPCELFHTLIQAFTRLWQGGYAAVSTSEDGASSSHGPDVTVHSNPLQHGHARQLEQLERGTGGGKGTKAIPLKTMQI